MLKPDDNDYTCNESSANSKKLKKPQIPLPGTNAYSREQWAEMYGVAPGRITDWAVEHEIPVFGPSNFNYHIDAEDWVSCFPKRKIVKKTQKPKPKKKARSTGGKKT